MKLKDLIDRLYKDTNGAYSRPELLKMLDTYQQKMLAHNCVEMESYGKLTVTTEVTVPAYVSYTGYNNVGTYSAATAFAPGDTFLYNLAPFRVVAPFTSANPVNLTDLVNYCEPISRQEYDSDGTSVKTYADGVVVADGDILIHEDKIYSVFGAGGTCTGVFADDIELFGIMPYVANPVASGTVAVNTQAIPEYVELTGLREVVKVGVLDSNNSWSEIYYPRIVQSTGRDAPVRIYTADLPEGVELDYQGYRWAAELVSERTSVLEVPEDQQYSLLRAYIMKEYEEMSYGAAPYWIREVPRLESLWMNSLNRSKPTQPRPARITCNPLAG